MDVEADSLLQAQTEYHELVLYSSCLHVVNRISQALVQEVPFTSRSTSIPSCGPPLGFAEDIAAGTVFVFTGLDALLTECFLYLSFLVFSRILLLQTTAERRLPPRYH